MNEGKAVVAVVALAHKTTTHHAPTHYTQINHASKINKAAETESKAVSWCTIIVLTIQRNGYIIITTHIHT